MPKKQGSITPGTVLETFFLNSDRLEKRLIDYDNSLKKQYETKIDQYKTKIDQNKTHIDKYKTEINEYNTRIDKCKKFDEVLQKLKTLDLYQNNSDEDKINQGLIKKNEESINKNKKSIKNNEEFIKVNETLIDELKIILENPSQIYTRDNTAMGAGYCFLKVYQHQCKEKGLSLSKPIVRHYGINPEKTKWLVNHIIAKNELHPIEQQLLDKAAEELDNFCGSEVFLKFDVANREHYYASNVVLVDIFKRITIEGITSIQLDSEVDGPETHAVVLWKATEKEITLIDPTCDTFSSFLDEKDMGKYKIVAGQTGSKLYCASNEYCASDKSVTPRDCIDIAVKIAFELNEHQKDCFEIKKVKCQAVDQISNHKDLHKNLSKLSTKDLQSSDFKVRQSSKSTVVKFCELFQKQYKEVIDFSKICTIENVKEVTPLLEKLAEVKELFTERKKTHTPSNNTKAEVKELSTKGKKTHTPSNNTAPPNNTVAETEELLTESCHEKKAQENFNVSPSRKIFQMSENEIAAKKQPTRFSPDILSTKFKDDHAKLQQSEIKIREQLTFTLSVINDTKFNQQSLGTLNKTLTDVLSVINDTKFNQQSLDTLKEALTFIKSYTNENCCDVLGYVVDSSSPVLAPVQDKEQKLEMLQTETMLTHYRKNFKHLLKDVYKEIRQFCEEGHANSLNILLSKNVWMSDLLSKNKGELGVLAMNNGFDKILNILYSNSSEMKRYSQQFLNVAIENENLSCAKILLKHDADPLPFLGTKNDYSEQMVNLFTDYLIKQGNNSRGNFYKGMHLYRSHKYEEAIKSFDKVIKLNQDLAIHALLHKGICYQYLNKEEEAKQCFTDVKEYESQYHDVNAIRNEAAKHLEAIKESKNRSDQVDEYFKSFSDPSNTFLHNHILNLEDNFTKFSQAIKYKNNTNATTSYQELTQQLAEVKYIKLQQELQQRVSKDIKDRIILTYQFKDVQQIYGRYHEILSSEGQDIYKEYYIAMQSIDKAVKWIGEISNGIIARDFI